MFGLLKSFTVLWHLNNFIVFVIVCLKLYNWLYVNIWKLRRDFVLWGNRDFVRVAKRIRILPVKGNTRKVRRNEWLSEWELEITFCQRCQKMFCSKPSYICRWFPRAVIVKVTIICVLLLCSLLSSSHKLNGTTKMLKFTNHVQNEATYLCFIFSRLQVIHNSHAYYHLSLRVIWLMFWIEDWFEVL